MSSSAALPSWTSAKKFGTMSCAPTYSKSFRRRGFPRLVKGLFFQVRVVHFRRVPLLGYTRAAIPTTFTFSTPKPNGGLLRVTMSSPLPARAISWMGITEPLPVIRLFLMTTFSCSTATSPSTPLLLSLHGAQARLPEEARARCLAYYPLPPPPCCASLSSPAPFPHIICLCLLAAVFHT
jgi:hypothetical protein